jgi:hypothetical protein
MSAVRIAVAKASARAWSRCLASLIRFSKSRIESSVSAGVELESAMGTVISCLRLDRLQRWNRCGRSFHLRQDKAAHAMRHIGPHLMGVLTTQVASISVCDYWRGVPAGLKFIRPIPPVLGRPPTQRRRMAARAEVGRLSLPGDQGGRARPLLLAQRRRIHRAIAAHG